MIEFRTWFCQIVTTCELISSGDALQRTWIGRERLVTSITDFGELYEQVFGDLDSDACLANFSPIMNRETFLAVERFLATIKVIDSRIAEDPTLEEPRRLFAEPIWKTLRETAAMIIALPEARSGRKDIRI